LTAFLTASSSWFCLDSWTLINSLTSIIQKILWKYMFSLPVKVATVPVWLIFLIVLFVSLPFHQNYGMPKRNRNWWLNATQYANYGTTVIIAYFFRRRLSCDCCIQKFVQILQKEEIKYLWTYHNIPHSEL
jgi:hypothetical protein